MPDLNEMELEAVRKIYEKDWYTRILRDGSMRGNEILQNEIFPGEEYKNQMRAYHACVGSLAGRDLDYIMAICAKMKILRERNVPFTLKSLVDIKGESPEMKQAIREELMKLTKAPKLEPLVDESQEAYRARQLEAAIVRNKKEFFLPNAKILVRALHQLFLSKSDLPELQRMQELAPYAALAEGLYDSVCQKVQDQKKNIRIADFQDTYDRMNYIFFYFDPAKGARRHAENILEGQIQEMGLEYLHLFLKAASHNSVHGTVVERLNEAALDSNKVLQFAAEFTGVENEFIVDMMDVQQPSQLRMLAKLTEQERLALALDPALRSRFTLRQDPKMNRRELYFDNISTQLRYSEADPAHLGDLKRSIALAHRAYVIQKDAQIRDLGEESLRANANSLREACLLLQYCTSTLRSSDEFRSMQREMKGLLVVAEKMAASEAGGEERERMQRLWMKQMAKAEKAVTEYLKKKGALSSKMNFKNSYEADRVAAARSLQQTLKIKRRSFERAVAKNADKQRENAARGNDRGQKVMEEPRILM